MRPIYPIQIHIPKTGGLSIRRTLSAEAFMPAGHMAIDSPCISELRTIFPRHHLFTFVREPMERLASVYRFFANDNSKTGINRINQEGLGRRYALLFHIVTHLSECADSNTFWKNLMLDKKRHSLLIQYLPHFDLMSRWTNGREDEITLYDFADFDNECRRLRVTCGLDDVEKNVKVTHKSENRGADELEDDTKALLREWLEPDYKLYEKMLEQKAARNTLAPAPLGSRLVIETGCHRIIASKLLRIVRRKFRNRRP
jgi:hypothetical protein